MHGRDGARLAAAEAAVAEVREGMTIGLGSGRAVLAVVAALAARWPGGPPLRAAVASPATEGAARAAGVDVLDHDGSIPLDLVLDGADEVTAELDLLKGGGGALLREKLLVRAAARFVVVAETGKRVERLGQTRRLPVEAVRFGWRDTARRLAQGLDDPKLRVGAAGEPFLTNEGHLIVDCAIPPGADPVALGAWVKATTGVVEHGFFVGCAHTALLGRFDGSVERLERSG